MKQALPAIFGLIAILFAASAAAKDPEPSPREARYEVELIVFRHIDQSRNTAETPSAGSLVQDSPLTLIPSEDPAIAFMNSLQVPTVETRASLPPTMATRRAEQTAARRPPTVGFFIMSPRAEFPDFVPMQTDAMALDRIYRRLDQLDAYQPVAHLGWIQPAHEADEATAYRLTPNPNAVGGVSGTITLYKSRYLHLQVELALDERSTVRNAYTRNVFTDVRETEGSSYKLQESRRIRRSDLHYFDHPLFGVIARIQRIDPDEAADTAG